MVEAHISEAQSVKYKFQEQKMGSPFELQFYETDSIKANFYAQKCFKMADSLNAIFSDYDTNSEVSQLDNNYVVNTWFPVSKPLMHLLKISKCAYEKSNGAFDVSIGQLTLLWRQTKQSKIQPHEQIINQKKAQIGFNHIKLDTINSAIKIDIPHIKFDFGGIAKGYVVDQCLFFFQKMGINYVLVNAAGNMAMGPDISENNTWKIAIENFESKGFLYMQNTGISTSGRQYQFVEINGKKYSHILNPKTGLGLKHNRQVSIIAENATTADWLSTACSILPVKKALSLAKKEKAHILILEPNSNGFKYWKSKGFPEFYKN